jgi:hypothetical protein
MKIIVFVFFAFIFTVEPNQDYYHYRAAFKDVISTSEAFVKSHCYCEDDFVIMKEVVPFNSMSFLFTGKLNAYTQVPAPSTDFLSYADLRLGRKKSRLKIFFSEERDGIFFAELFCDVKKKIVSYDDRPAFGLSHVYMFRVNQGGYIELVDQKEISNN